MSTAVKVLSRLQLPADLLAGFTRATVADAEPAPDIVMYLGCNVLKTPHIALLCLEVLARLGTRYEVLPDRPFVAVSFSTARATPRPPGGSAAIPWPDSPARAPLRCSRGARRATSN